MEIQSVSERKVNEAWSNFQIFNNFDHNSTFALIRFVVCENKIVFCSKCGYYSKVQYIVMLSQIVVF